MTVFRLGKILLSVALLLSSVAVTADTTHKVTKGDTLWEIAKKYNTTTKAIAQANGMKEDATLSLGKVLRIPTKSSSSKSASASSSASKSAEASSDSDLVKYALSCRGARYTRGGVSRSGFDCSGFTRYVYAKFGIALPHSSAAQARLGKSVSKSQLQPGDLVFFETYRKGISHVGIYIGDNKFVHAATYGRGVRTDSLSDSYYGPRYRGARRVK